MNSKGKNILEKFTMRWKLLLGLEVFLYAIGASILMYFVNFNFISAVITFFCVTAIMTIRIKPWRPTVQKASSYIDHQLNEVEYSSSLLLSATDNLTSIAKLQRQNVSEKLVQYIKTIQPPHNIFRGAIVASVLIILGLLAFQFNISDYFKTPKTYHNTPNAVIFQPKDSTTTKTQPPALKEQAVFINYPNYTKLSTKKQDNMNIKALENSKLTWQLTFDAKVDSVFMESMGTSYTMVLKDGIYTRTSKLSSSGFYNFRFVDQHNQSYTSELYAIEVVKDKSPVLEIEELKQFTTFNYDESKLLQFNTNISDDYGIADAFIIATVSKGSGESVKFREEKLTFDTAISKGSKSMLLPKKINLDHMNMEPGDELYFYIEALDVAQPLANRARSETYFAVIKDTTTNDFAVEGTLGVDRMPDYFRSQRQLIIDTEKLIADKPNITTEEFKFRSNELGYDQKALRLKYGEFMGVETEEVGGGINQESLESFEQQEEQETTEGTDDPLAEYTHDHDGDNEHNLVEEEDHNHNDGEDSEDPLEAYTHNHEDSEMATLFEESLRSKLLRAMNEMWDAELYLRLYEPEKSLPYQYKALKLIQEIKNSARIYVHRIGFDPPPIKEDKRLTGKLDEIKNVSKSDAIKEEDSFVFLKKVASRLETLVKDPEATTKNDRLLFEYAGNELAELAIEQPGKHLKTLQQLKQLTMFGQSSEELLVEVQKGVLDAIPFQLPNASKTNLSTSELNELLLKALDPND